MAGSVKEMSFIDHLEELRKRIIRSLLSVIIFSAACYAFSTRLIDFVAKPLPEVFFMSPTEGFLVRIKISVIVGVIASVPVIIYQAWKFITPGLFVKEKKAIVPIIILSTLFFFIGGGFCFFLVVPTAIRFLLEFSTDKLQPLIRISDYVSFAGYMTLAFGTVFELPIVSFFLAKMGILTPKTMVKGRRYALVGILILAAVLTPPDIFSQIMLAVPLYFLYEVSIIIVKVVHKRKIQKEMEE